MKTFLYLLALFVISGCASQVPAPIAKAPAVPLSVTEAKGTPGQHIGQDVRWGGEIISIENQPAQTWVEVVSRELRSNGRPIANSQSSGRFIASFQGFIDPAVYTPGRLLTIAGTIQGETTRTIGEYSYLFPVVAITASHLWEPPSETAPPPYPPPWWYYDPWYYDPWYWPYYPRPYPPHHW